MLGYSSQHKKDNVNNFSYSKEQKKKGNVFMKHAKRVTVFACAQSLSGCIYLSIYL
jgi:hypothetical protein